MNDPSLSLSRVWKQETNNSVFWIEFNEPTVTLFTLGPHRLLLRPEAGKMVSWNHWDCNIRLTSVDTDKTLSVVENHHNDPVTACANDDVILVSGGQSGVVKVWEITSRRTDFRLKANLHGHSDAITAVSISHEFSLMVTGSGGYDCSVILWDLNKLSFVRSLDRMPGPIVATAISQTTVRPEVLLRFLFIIIFSYPFLGRHRRCVAAHGRRPERFDAVDGQRQPGQLCAGQRQGQLRGRVLGQRGHQHKHHRRRVRVGLRPAVVLVGPDSAASHPGFLASHHGRRI